MTRREKLNITDHCQLRFEEDEIFHILFSGSCVCPEEGGRVDQEVVVALEDGVLETEGVIIDGWQKKVGLVKLENRGK